MSIEVYFCTAYTANGIHIKIYTQKQTEKNSFSHFRYCYDTNNEIEMKINFLWFSFYIVVFGISYRYKDIVKMKVKLLLLLFQLRFIQFTTKMMEKSLTCKCDQAIVTNSRLHFRKKFLIIDGLSEGCSRLSRFILFSVKHVVVQLYFYFFCIQLGINSVSAVNVYMKYSIRFHFNLI